MAYRPDFWVAVATVAPVLALADALPLATLVPRKGWYTRRRATLDVLRAGVFWLYVVAAINYVALAIACHVALTSPELGKNAERPGYSLTIITLAFIALILFVFASAGSRMGEQKRTEQAERVKTAGSEAPR